MKYCPLISFGKQYCTEVSCMGEDCAFADTDGDCLIAQALAGYVAHIGFESRSAGIAIDKVKGTSYLET